MIGLWCKCGQRGYRRRQAIAKIGELSARQDYRK